MIDVVMITTDKRPNLLLQSVGSLFINGNRANFSLTIVHDLTDTGERENPKFIATEIFPNEQRGASACRNIGASSIPKYRRQKYVLFLDDDVYMAPGWDAKLIELAEATMLPRPCIISGYSHPYNQTAIVETGSHLRCGVPLVISSVAMMMPWAIFDDVGPWDEPGGAGASEDYQICMRAKDKGYGFAVTEPQVVLHTGLTDSSGKRIVGYDELAAQNDKLLDVHKIRGKVVFS